MQVLVMIMRQGNIAYGIYTELQMPTGSECVSACPCTHIIQPLQIMVRSQSSVVYRSMPLLSERSGMWLHHAVADPDLMCHVTAYSMATVS